MSQQKSGLSFLWLSAVAFLVVFISEYIFVEKIWFF